MHEDTVMASQLVVGHMECVPMQQHRLSKVQRQHVVVRFADFVLGAPWKGKTVRRGRQQSLDVFRGGAARVSHIQR